MIQSQSQRETEYNTKGFRLHHMRLPIFLWFSSKKIAVVYSFDIIHKSFNNLLIQHTL